MEEDEGCWYHQRHWTQVCLNISGVKAGGLCHVAAASIPLVVLKEHARVNRTGDVVTVFVLEDEHHSLCEPCRADRFFLALVSEYRQWRNCVSNTVPCRWHRAHSPNNTFMLLIQPGNNEFCSCTAACSIAVSVAEHLRCFLRERLQLC